MQKVSVQLFNSFPEILSNVSGTVQFKFDNCQPNTSGKLYDFFFDDTFNDSLEGGEIVICQVKNSMTVGVVRAVNVNTISDEEFLEATIHRSEKVKNGYRLILAVIDVAGLRRQLQFKHLYEKKKIELESKPTYNPEAFQFALDNL